MVVVSRFLFERLISEYLFQCGRFETFSSHFLETNVCHLNISESGQFLLRLILQGRWDPVVEFLSKFHFEEKLKNDKLHYFVLKQQYLEALSWQGGGGHRHALLPWKPSKDTENITDDIDIEGIVYFLKKLEIFAEKAEFDELCKCLTLEKLSDSSIYQHWSVSKGRIDTYFHIAALIPQLGCGDNLCENYLTTLVAMGLESVSCGSMTVASHIDEAVNEYQSKSHSSLEWKEDLAALPFPFDDMIYQSRVKDEYTPISSISKIECLSMEEVAAKEPNTLISPPKSKAFSPMPESLPPPPPASIPSAISWRVDIVSPKMQPENDARNRNINDQVLMTKNDVSEKKTSSAVGWEIPMENSKDKAVSSSRSNRNSNSSSNSSNINNNNSNSNNNSNNASNGIMMDSDVNRQISSRVLASPTTALLTSPPPAPPSNASSSVSASKSSKRNHSTVPLSSPHPPAIPILGSQEDTPSSSHVPMSPSSASVSSTTSFRSQLSQKSSFSKTPSNNSAAMGNKFPLTKSRNGEVDNSSGRLVSWVPLPLFHHPVPIRCVLSLPSSFSSLTPSSVHEDGVDHVYVAVGTNQRSLHILDASLLSSVHNSSTSPKASTAPTVTLLHEFQGIHAGSVYCMDYSPLLGSLVTGSNDKTIRFHNLTSGKSSSPLVSHNGTVRIVKYRPTRVNEDGDSYNWSSASVLASGGAGDCCVRVWDAQQGLCVSKLMGNEGAIHGLSWLDNNCLVSGCEKGQLILHDLRDPNNPIWSVKMNNLIENSFSTLNCDQKFIDSNFTGDYGIGSLTSNSSKTTCYVGCLKGLFCSLDLRSQKVHYLSSVHNDDIRSMITLNSSKISTASSAAPSSFTTLATASYDQSCQLLTMNNMTGQLIKSQRLSGGHQDKILSITQTSNHQDSLLTSGADGKVLLWSKHTTHH